MEVRRHVPPLEPRPLSEKTLQGGLLLVGLVLLIVGPLMFFSTLNPTLQENAVTRATLSAAIQVASAQHGEKNTILYSAGQKLLVKVSDASVDTSQKDVYEVEFPELSDSLWLISQSLQQQLADLLAHQWDSDTEASIVVSCDFDMKAGKEAASTSARGVIATVGLTSNSTREKLQRVLGGNLTREPLFIPVAGAFSDHVTVDSRMTVQSSTLQEDVSSVVLIFYPPDDSSGRVILPYWKFVTSDLDMLRMRVITEKVAPAFSGSSSSSGGYGTGAIAIYIGVVYTIGRFLRLVFQDASKRMIYEELPDTSLLQDLCNGIYIARIGGDLETEYKLYFQLVEIYRSPQLLLDVTQFSEPQPRPNPDDDDASARARRSSPPPPPGDDNGGGAASFATWLSSRENLRSSSSSSSREQQLSRGETRLSSASSADASRQSGQYRKKVRLRLEATAVRPDGLPTLLLRGASSGATRAAHAGTSASSSAGTLGDTQHGDMNEEPGETDSALRL